MDITKCNCNPTTSTAHLGLNMCVGQVEIGGGSITQETTVIPTTNNINLNNTKKQENNYTFDWYKELAGQLMYSENLIGRL